MVTGLEPSLCSRFYSQVRYPYNEFVHSIPSYFSKCIITTIRLSGLSWRTKTTFAPLASRLITLVLQHTCNTETLCVIQPTFLKLASTIGMIVVHGLGTMTATLLLRFITLVLHNNLYYEISLHVVIEAIKFIHLRNAHKSYILK